MGKVKPGSGAFPFAGYSPGPHDAAGEVLRSQAAPVRWAATGWASSSRSASPGYRRSAQARPAVLAGPAAGAASRKAPRSLGSNALGARPVGNGPGGGGRPGSAQALSPGTPLAWPGCRPARPASPAVCLGSNRDITWLHLPATGTPARAREALRGDRRVAGLRGPGAGRRHLCADQGRRPRGPDQDVPERNVRLEPRVHQGLPHRALRVHSVAARYVIARSDHN